MFKSNYFIGIEQYHYSKFIEICSTMKKVSRRKVQWLKLIEANKLICPVTKKKVEYVQLDKHPLKKGGFSYHYNFYSKDGDMFTVDHIIPLSKGGSRMNINNLQPMIDIHNWEKSDKI